MSLINCPECNKEISDKASSCPHCGYPIEAGFPSNEDAGSIRKSSQEITTRQGIITILSIFLLATFIFMVGLNDSKKPKPKAKDKRPSRFSICFDSQTAVNMLLKSPSTAKYSDCDDVKITNLGGGSYKVIGAVDASNSFGAKLRKTWTVKLKYKNGKPSVEEIPTLY